jgi:hypothetical protein
MEKFSKEWENNFAEKLSEKFKYLFLSYMSKDYELLMMKVTDIEFSKNEISEFDVDVEFDYHGACDGDGRSVAHMITFVTEDFHEFFYNHRVDPKTFKFTKEQFSDLIVNEPAILDFHYKMDELHKFYMYIRITYDN